MLYDFFRKNMKVQAVRDSMVKSAEEPLSPISGFSAEAEIGINSPVADEIVIYPIAIHQQSIAK